MTHIITVRDLIAELQSHALDLQVVVVVSSDESRRIIGVIERNAVVYLDYSMDNSDKLPGFPQA